MTKKSQSKSGTSTSLGASILTVIVVVIGFILSQLSGNNPTSTTTTLAPAATVTSAPPTATVAVATSVASVGTIPPSVTPGGRVQTITLVNGFGAKKGFWEVYFTKPLESRNRRDFKGGTDTAIATAIGNVKTTLDIAAFEWDNEVINAAVLAAVERGVTVRMVADNEHTVDDDGSTITELEAAGVPIVYDDRSALMHNKFMIMDSAYVWTGSTNWTMNGVYRNYNNLLMLRSQRAVDFYQREFNEMFVDKKFGPRSPKGNSGAFTQDGTSIEIWFASEDDVIGPIIREINNAQKTVRFMAFSFTQDPMGDALLARAAAGVTVVGVFEKTGSQTQFSEMTRLFCAGLDVRQDGYGGVMHHKVVIIDDTTVIAGSFNFSDNAVESNDENLLIIKDADLVQQYIAEFQRVQSISTPPQNTECN
jgi:phosphatidylserine/phosphatidylglycerophosphate/cardiolipin synthase-like enzyme